MIILLTFSNTSNKAKFIGTIIVVAAVLVIHIETNMVVKHIANRSLEETFFVKKVWKLYSHYSVLMIEDDIMVKLKALKSISCKKYQNI